MEYLRLQMVSEDPGSAPSTHTVANNPVTPTPGDLMSLLHLPAPDRRRHSYIWNKSKDYTFSVWPLFSHLSSPLSLFNWIENVICVYAALRENLCKLFLSYHLGPNDQNEVSDLAAPLPVEPFCQSSPKSGSHLFSCVCWLLLCQPDTSVSHLWEG